MSAEDTRREDERAQALTDAGATAVDALRALYELLDRDDIAYGEYMYEIEKAVRS